MAKAGAPDEIRLHGFNAVQAVFARAAAGYTGPRGRDGLRVTAISPSGVPTCGPGPTRVSPA